MSGSALFTDAIGDRGTEIHLDLVYELPAGPIGAAVQKLRGQEPVQRARDDLRRFRQVLETGEVVRSEGLLRGTRRSAICTSAGTAA